jgi:hypothetical protein
MTIGLSAGDWIRLRRLRGGSRYQTEQPKDIQNVTLPAGAVRPFPITRDVGSSKTRRETSNWIDYVASKRADYVLQSTGSNCATVLRRSTVDCMCGPSTSSVLAPRVTGCLRCSVAQHLRLR